MSIVGLKNIIFGRSTRRGSSSAASDDTAVDNTDPERQPLLTTIKSKSSSIEQEPTRPFRLDARVISDATIGLSDGLTVPFALTAGLSALGQTKVVIYGGLAELIAGAISMGLGGYLGAKSEAASYKETRAECVRSIEHNPEHVHSAVLEVFEPFNLPAQTLDDISAHLARSPRQVDFLMQFQHCEQEPASNRAAISALTIAAGYLLGGLIPLFPYFFVDEGQVDLALWISVLVMAVALFAFGYVKTCAVSGWHGGRCVWEAVKGGVEMVLVGGAAAGAAMGLVKLFDGMANGGINVAVWP
ncbi:hypothetical protein ACHAQH_000809 [Verticillium albo-atrum]